MGEGSELGLRSSCSPACPVPHPFLLIQREYHLVLLPQAPLLRVLNCSLPTGPRKWAQPHNQQPYSSLWRDAHVAICPQKCPRGRWHRRQGTGQAQGWGGLRGAVTPVRRPPDPGGSDRRRRGSTIFLGRNSSESLPSACTPRAACLSAPCLGTAPSGPRLPPAAAAQDQCR